MDQKSGFPVDTVPMAISHNDYSQILVSSHSLEQVRTMQHYLQYYYVIAKLIFLKIAGSSAGEGDGGKGSQG